MKYRFYFLVLLGLSCQTKPAEQNATADTTKADAVVPSSGQPPVITAPAMPSFPSTYVIKSEIDYTAFILPGSRIYSKASEESDILMETETLLPTQTHTPTPASDEAETDICNRYFWYNVLAGSKDGWVYGRNVLQDQPSEPSTSIEIADTPYTLYYLMDSGTGPSNSEGLTGCNQYYIPYFWNKEKNTLKFIRDSNLSLPDNSFTTSYGFGWLSFVSSEGGGARIQSIEYNKAEATFYVSVNVSYQDGGAKFNMTIAEREGDLVLLSYNQVTESGD